MIQVRVIDDLFDRSQTVEIHHAYNPDWRVIDYIPDGYRDGYKVTLQDRDIDWREARIIVPNDGALILVVSERAVEGYLIVGAIHLAMLAWASLPAIVQTALVVAAMTGISYAIGQLIGTPGTGNEAETSNSFDAIQPTVASGTTIPVVYGEHRVSGHLIDFHSEIDTEGDQRGYFLFALGHGRIDAISGETGGDAGEIDDVDRDHAACATIEIDGNSIENYDDITVSFRAGELDQSVIPGFQKVSATRSVALELEQPEDGDGVGIGGPGDWFVYDTDDDIDEFVLKLRCPQGLYATADEKGEIKDEELFIDVRYRLQSGGAYTYLVMTGPWGDPSRITTSASEPPTGGRSIRFERRQTNPVDLEIRHRVPARGLYRIEARRNNAEWDTVGGSFVQTPDVGNSHKPPDRFSLVRWEATEQILEEQLAHPGLALVAVKAIPSDQLSGSVPRATWVIRGVRVRVWDGADPESPTFRWEWTQNPAWVVLDILTHEERGSGAYLYQKLTGAALETPYVPMHLIDIESFKAWADFCDELVSDGAGGPQHARCRFDGIFDQQQDSWQSVLDVCSTARAAPTLWGDKIAIKYEHTRSLVQVFGDGNIIRGSFTRTFFDRADQPNAVIAQFRNRANNYEPDAIQVESDAVTQGIEPMRAKTIQLRGVVRDAQAHREANFSLLMLENVDESVSFECALHALVAEPGDLVGITRNLPTWGQSGQVAGPGPGTDTITLKESVTIGSAPTELMLVRPTGEVVFAQVYFPDTPPGEYDAGDTITVSADWDGLLPAEGDMWTLGAVNQSQRLYVIQDTTLTARLTRKITAYKYPGNDALEAADGSVSILIPGTDGPKPPKFPPDVTEIRAIESTAIAPDGHVVAAIEVFWQFGTGYTSKPAGAVFLRERGKGRFKQVGLSFQESLLITEHVSPNTHYQVAVVSLSAFSLGKKPKDAPKASIFVAGRGVGMDVPVELYPTVQGSTLGLSWDDLGVDADGFARGSNVARYEVRRGEDWRTAFLVAETVSKGARIDAWYPGMDRLMVRAIDRAGNLSGQTTSLVPVVQLPDPTQIVHQQDEVEADWPGTLTLCQVNAIGRLELTVGATTGFYVSEVVDLGSVDNYDISLAVAIVQHSLLLTPAVRKLGIGSIDGPRGYFATGDLVTGDTSGATGLVVAKRVDGDTELYVLHTAGTFALAEVIRVVTIGTYATVTAAPVEVTAIDTLATGIVDHGGPVGEDHLTSPAQRSRVVLTTSDDGLRYTPREGFSRGVLRCRYVQTELYLATDNPAFWAPQCERLELTVVDGGQSISLPLLAA